MKNENFFFTTLGGYGFNITINTFYLLIPSLVPSPEQQKNF